MSRGLIINAATGAIKRQIIGPPAFLVQQRGAGETLYVVTDDTGAFINDAVVRVSETGELEALTGVAPALTIEFVA